MSVTCVGFSEVALLALAKLSDDHSPYPGQLIYYGCLNDPEHSHQPNSLR